MLEKLWIISIGILIMMTGCNSDQEEPWRDSFELHPNFEMQLIAHEPAVIDPVDLLFDEAGRLFVLEMPGYPFSEGESRIIHLEDLDQDGQYESRKLVADGLRQATSFLRFGGGFLVASPPNLLMLRDTDSDGTLDEREVLMTGFSEGNLQHNFNGLTYGHDNWVYAANGGNGGQISWADDPESGQKLGAGDFRIYLDQKKFERSGRSSGGFELALNDWGHYFGTHNLYHIRQLVIPERYHQGQYLTPPHSLAQISDHEEDGLARIYAIGEQNTRVNHPEQSGYFSGACGIEHYGGALFPEEFQGNIFTADVVLNLIHRDVLTPDGSAYRASRGREAVEFLASSDRSFRPVNLKTGTDGALYVVDMHREVIEHPEWIPDEIEVNLDLKAGTTMGRIYRIIPRETAQISPCICDKEDAETLLTCLASDNQMCRLIAQEQIVNNKMTQLVPALRAAMIDWSPVAFIHGLWTLHGLNQLTPADVLAALKHPVSGVREQALVLSETVSLQENTKAILASLRDDSPRVRLQAVLTIGHLIDQQQLEVDEAYTEMIDALEDLTHDVWLVMATASTLNRNASEAIKKLCALQTAIASPLLKMVFLRLGQTGNQRAVRRGIELAIQGITQPSGQAEALIGLADGLQISGLPRPLSKGSLERLEGNSPVLDIAIWKLREVANIPNSKYQNQHILRASRAVLDDNLSDEERLDQLNLMAQGDRSVIIDPLYQLLDPTQPAPLQQAAIQKLEEIPDPQIGRTLIAKWPTLSPGVRRVATNILLYQKHNQPYLLDGLENGNLGIAEFNFDLERRRRLLFSDDPAIRRRAEALFSDAGVVTRSDALTKMKAALELASSSKRGEEVFQLQCAQCHIYKTQGTEVGPNLTECNRMSKHTLLHHIIDPNAVAEPAFINHVVELEDGKQYSGILHSETSDAITLKVIGGGTQTISRNKIKAFRSTGKSFMPEGLEAQINEQQMADLIAFLQQG